MMKKIVLAIGLFAVCANGMQAADHVMAATKKAEVREVPATLNLSLAEAQDYAVETNRSLRNASLAVQKAYAQRWQTIASMLPSLDGSVGKTLMLNEDFKEHKINFMGKRAPCRLGHILLLLQLVSMVKQSWVRY